jgi:hypothetical protein
MFSLACRCARSLTACLLAAIFAVPTNLMAENHLVSPAELQKEAVAATQSRESHLRTMNDFLSSASAEKALQSAHLDPAKVKTALSKLSDEELAQMAKRADKAQASFAAGDISTRDLTFMILGVAVLVLVIVAVR